MSPGGDRFPASSGSPARLPLVLCAAATLACGPAADSSTSASPTPEDVAAGLRPAVQIEGDAPTLYALETRMTHYRVPGVSVAVLDDGEIVWARGWGVADTEAGAPVTSETLFQAASISKPVAALGALSLVDERRIELDGPVNRHLTTWRIPENGFTADSAVTLRGILSHTAGLTVWGFPGYRRDRPFNGARAVATNVDVLDGNGNTDPVRVFRTPGVAWLYSGGGYTVMEQMLEDVTGHPFDDWMRERVLEPAGMTRSTYAQPLPEARWPEASRGHRRDGSQVEGGWHSYPEQAAAGLWTTPEELLELSRHLLGVLHEEVQDGVVERATLTEMLRPHRAGEEGFEPYGLGFGVEGEGESLSFGHGGSNAGFRARWLVFPTSGDGAVVMTNGDGGAALSAEILRSLAVAYGWPRFQPEIRARRLLTAEALVEYTGAYAVEGEPGPVLTVEAGDGVLTLTVPGQETVTLHAEVDAGDRFFDASDGQEVVFERGPDGSVTSLTPTGGARFVRR